MNAHTTPPQQQLDDKDVEENGFAAAFVTPPSTATSSTETVSTNDEDARHCEEWELFSNFDGPSRPSSESRSDDGQRSTRSTDPWEAGNESTRVEESPRHQVEDDATISSASDVETNGSEEEFHEDENEECGERTISTDQSESNDSDDIIATNGSSEAATLEPDDGFTATGLVRECSLGDLMPPRVIHESARSDRSSRTVSSEIRENIVPIVTSSRIQVFVRVRPLGREETDTAAVMLGESANSLCVQSTHLSSVTECSVDRVFSDGSTQEHVYQGVEPGVHASLEGLNATIFAYGQTGTGKTHTMFGDEAEGLGGGDLCCNVTTSNSTIPESWGVIPRALCELITKAHAMEAQGAKAQLSCSFLQIYNDRVFDLLTDRRRQKPLIIREQPMVDGSTNVVIQGLSSEPITSLSDALQLVRRGRVNRSVRETELNASSSRSHAIVQVHVTIETKLPNGDKRIRSSRLNLVDLAGSEKWNTDLEMADRHTVELKNINTSLSALGNCIAALAETGRRHIPYRDSTLTRVLQDSFGGNTLAFLIATVSSSQKATEETIRTLQFADRARSVMQVVKVNESFSGSSELLAAKAQIKSLRERLVSDQRRRHETRLKEYEAMQHDFATKLQAKDEEIQRLARDNQVFAKWRAEDVARIRALESRIKEAEDGGQPAKSMTQPEQTWQHDDRVTIASEDVGPVGQATPFHKDRRREDNQAATDNKALRSLNDRDVGDKRPSLIRKSSIKNKVNTPKQRESSPVPAPAHDRNGKPRVKSYRSLLEKYALPSHKGHRTEPQRDAPRQNHRENNNNDSNNNGVGSLVKPKETSDEPLQPIESTTATALSPQKRDHFSLATSVTGNVSHPPSTRAMSFVQASQSSPPVQTQSPTTLYKADSLPALTQTRQQPSPSQQPQLRNTPAQPVQDVYTNYHYNTLCDLTTKHAWQLPPVLSDIPSMTRTEPSVPVTVQPEICTKHSLKGCVLCAVKDSSWSPGPTLHQTSSVPSIKSSTIASSIELTTGGGDGHPCERHQLPGCFICTKTISATNWRSAASLPTGAKTTTPNPTGSSSSTSTSRHLATSNYPGVGQSLAPPKQDTKCLIHKLANCVICAGPTRLEPSSPSKTTYALPDPMWRSTAFPAQDTSPASSSAATSYTFATATTVRDIQPPSFSYSPSSSSSAFFRTDDGPVHTNPSSSMLSSSSSLIRSSVKQFAHDNTHFNSLVREASDAANTVLRRRA